MDGPEIPAELWMLANEEATVEESRWVESSGDDDDVGLIVCLTEADARQVARWQYKEYDIKCYPVRVK